MEDEKLKHGVHEELRCFSKGFYVTGIQHSRKDGKCVLLMKETLWKNNLNFVKYIPMIYVSYITVSEKKNRRHYFRTTPYI
jgi:hypothetical protein